MLSSNDNCNMFGWEPPIVEQNLKVEDTVAAINSDTASAYRKPKKGLIELPTDFTPTNYSVILGRGKGSYNYVGNKRCRVIVNSFLGEYDKCNTRQDRSVVVSKVLDFVKDACPIGGFITQENGSWYTVDEKIAREKIFTMFRDCQNSQSGRSPASSRRSSISSSPHKLTSVQPPETRSHGLDINFAAALPLPQHLSNQAHSVHDAAALSVVEYNQNPECVDMFEPIKFDDNESMGESVESGGSFYDIDSCSLCTI
jgi:hypothetical protein